MGLQRDASRSKGSPLKHEVSNWVVEWFSSRGKIRCAAHEALEIDYLQSGLLASLEIVELVAELEDRFGVQFSEAEMQDPRFSTIGGIAELVASLMKRDGATQANTNRAGSDQADLDQSNFNRKQLAQSTKVS